MTRQFWRCGLSSSDDCPVELRDRAHFLMGISQRSQAAVKARELKISGQATGSLNLMSCGYTASSLDKTTQDIWHILKGYTTTHCACCMDHEQCASKFQLV